MTYRLPAIRSGLALLLMAVSFRVPAESQTRYTDTALAFVAQFPSLVLKSCNLTQLMCSDIPLKVLRVSSDNSYGEERIYREISGGGLAITVEDQDVLSVEINDPLVTVPLETGIRVGDRIEAVEALLGPGHQHAGSIYYVNDKEQSNVQFTLEKGRISRIRWERYSD